MIDAIKPITKERRAKLKELMSKVSAAKPSVEEDLKAYEALAVQYEKDIEYFKKTLDRACERLDNKVGGADILAALQSRLDDLDSAPEIYSPSYVAGVREAVELAQKELAA